MNYLILAFLFLFLNPLMGSADDFDLVKTRSLNKTISAPGVYGTDQFFIEKAKSVRKATRFA